MCRTCTINKLAAMSLLSNTLADDTNARNLAARLAKLELDRAPTVEAFEMKETDEQIKTAFNELRALAGEYTNAEVEAATRFLQQLGKTAKFLASNIGHEMDMRFLEGNTEGFSDNALSVLADNARATRITENLRGIVEALGGEGGPLAGVLRDN